MLLLTALLLSALAWAFWHYADTYAFDILATFSLLVLAADNFRLRRALKKR